MTCAKKLNALLKYNFILKLYTTVLHPLLKLYSSTFFRKNPQSPTRKISSRSPSSSPTRRHKPDNSTSKSPSKRAGPENGPTTKIDRKLGTQRKTAGVRNLPKIDRSRKQEKQNGRSNSKSPDKKVNGKADKEPVKDTSAPSSGSQKSMDSCSNDLNTVKEEEDS